MRTALRSDRADGGGQSLALGVLGEAFEISLGAPLRVIQDMLAIKARVERRRQEPGSVTHPALNLGDHRRDQRFLLSRIDVELHNLRKRPVIPALREA